MFRHTGFYRYILLYFPFRFGLADYYIGTGTVLAVVLVLVLVLAVMLVGAVLYRRKRRKAGAADRVSFENPSYLREMNLENLQVRTAVRGPQARWGFTGA